jgi:hypothetical protein
LKISNEIKTAGKMPALQLQVKYLEVKNPTRNVGVMGHPVIGRPYDFVTRRRTSRMPVPNPITPNTIIIQGRVCSQRSRKYPMPPPTSIAMTNTKGNSVALADWRRQR